MLKRTVPGTSLIVLLVILSLAFDFSSVRASSTIYIMADGSIYPLTAPIVTSDNVTYTLTGNINSDADGIVVERDNIVIDGAGYMIDGWGHFDAPYCKGVDLSGRTNVTVRNTHIQEFFAGIYLGYSSDNNVSGNTFQYSMASIYLDYSSNNSISGNTITRSYSGIYLFHSSNNNVSGNTFQLNLAGIELDYSSNNSVSKNNITDNYYYGIWVWHSFNNNIGGNNITENSCGISLDWGSSGNLVSENTIASGNSGIDIYYSSDNIVYHNNFINNTQPVYVWYSGYVNIWDNGYPCGGNYWSSYTGSDFCRGPYQNETGSDGIGDAPYVFTSNRDNYPLMGPLGQSTIQGQNVTVFPSSNVGLIFENVTTSGSTIVSSPQTKPSPPSGFKLKKECFNIETTANYSGKITIRIVYDDSGMTQKVEEKLKLLQWNETTEQWDDRTTYVDTENNIVYGETNHLSLFSLALETILGDVNGDTKVDITDISMVIAAYLKKNTSPGWYDPYWYANRDLNGDGKIDITDISLVISQYGKIW